MLQKIVSFVEDNSMLEKKDKVVIGVSGGADSVCLFFVLLELKQQYNLELFVVHVNHGIRGIEADEDEAYVKQLCQQENVFFQSIHADVRTLAKNQGVTEEEAGRNLRYEAFYNACKKHQCHKIAIAHNKNDQAETVLFHLFRGSGLKGLTGIPPVRQEVIRPLLCISRGEIETYLTQRNILYQTDRTNLEEKYSRNKIRRKVLPYVTGEINGKAAEHVVQVASTLKEIQEYINNNAQKAYVRVVKHQEGKYVLPVEEFFQEDRVIQKEILRNIINELAGKLKDIEANHIDLILQLKNKQVGKRLDLPYEICAIREYEAIRIYQREKEKDIRLEKEDKLVEIFASGVYQVPWSQMQISFEIKEYKKNEVIPKNNCTKWFDYDRIKSTVFIRTRQPGDYFQLDGKGSRKKIKTYFIDRKIPVDEREKVPLLADGSHVMWIIGERISEAYKVSEETNRILEVKIFGGIQNGRED